MQLLGDVLALVSAAALGVYSGAMLTEGGVLVPFWRELPAARFFAWYAANGDRLLRFFGPVTALAALAALSSVGVAFALARPGRWAALAAALLVLVTVAMFPLYFQGANARFASASVAEGELAAELARWASWHRARTGLSLAALAASLAAL